MGTTIEDGMETAKTTEKHEYDYYMRIEKIPMKDFERLDNYLARLFPEKEKVEIVQRSAIDFNEPKAFYKNVRVGVDHFEIPCKNLHFALRELERDGFKREE